MHFTLIEAMDMTTQKYIKVCKSSLGTLQMFLPLFKLVTDEISSVEGVS